MRRKAATDFARQLRANQLASSLTLFGEHVTDPIELAVEAAESKKAAKADQQSQQSLPPVLNKSVNAPVTDATHPTVGKRRVDPSAFLKPAVQIKSKHDTGSDEVPHDKKLVEEDVDDEGSESGAEEEPFQPPDEDQEMQD